MSVRRITAYACLAVATTWGAFPPSAQAGCGLFDWLWGGTDATTAYYAPYAAGYTPYTAGYTPYSAGYAPYTAYSPAVASPGYCGGYGVTAQRPNVQWVPVTNYATTTQRVPVTVYRPSLFGNTGGGGLFGCNLFGNQVNRVPVYTPTTSYMPPAAPLCNTCPTTSYMPPVAPTCNTCPTTSYSLPVTTTYMQPAPSCSTCPTTTYSAPTETIIQSGSCSSCGSHGSCSCGSVGLTTTSASGSYVGAPSQSTYSDQNAFANGSSVPADVRPSLNYSERPQIDGNSLGLPETSYQTNYGDSNVTLTAPAVRAETTVTPGPMRFETDSSFGVPTVRPFDSSSRQTNLRPAASEEPSYGVAPMRDPETRGQDGRLLAPPLLDPRSKTASRPQSDVRPALAFDDRLPVLPASLTTSTQSDVARVSANFAAPASSIETTGLRPLADEAPLGDFAAVAHVSRKAPVAYESSRTVNVAPGVTQLDESVWQSARP